MEKNKRGGEEEVSLSLTEDTRAQHGNHREINRLSQINNVTFYSSKPSSSSQLLLFIHLSVLQSRMFSGEQMLQCVISYRGFRGGSRGGCW